LLAAQVHAAHHGALFYESRHLRIQSRAAASIALAVWQQPSLKHLQLQLLVSQQQTESNKQPAAHPVTNPVTNALHHATPRHCYGM